MSVDVVRGEMRTWSDLDHRDVADPVVAAVLADLLPGGERALVVGPHTPDAVAAVAARYPATTVLVRSLEDAGRLADAVPSARVLAGSLEALGEEGFDAVVAADGLDRVLGADAPDVDWAARLALLRSRLVERGTLVLALDGEASVTALLDRRPPDERHGDEEWVPLHDDPARPVSLDALRAAAGGEAAVLALSSASGGPAARAAVDVRALADGTSSWAVRALLAAVSAQADPEVLLAPPDDALDRLVRAGRLADAAPRWLLVSGPAGAVRAWAGRDPVVRGTRVDGGWQVDPVDAGGPATVPDGPTVEAVLLRLCAAEDVPAVRALARRLAAEAPRGSVWDETVLTDGAVLSTSAGAGVQPGLPPAAAWSRFADRLLARPHRHPWPPWIGRRELTATFAEMSGLPSDAESLVHAERAAAELAEARGERPWGEPPEQRTPQEALAAAEAAGRRVVELTGVVAGLERTLEQRDKALRRRERRIVALREQRARGRVPGPGSARAAFARLVRGVGRRLRRR